MRYLLALLLLTLAGCAEARPEHSAPYAVRLEFQRGLCSGTVVGKDLILSAAHCFDGNRLLRIDGEDAYALEIARDGKDHVLARVTKRFTRWASMGPLPEQGDEVSWIGNPAGEFSVYRQGYVARVMPDELYIEAPAFGGDSGSGLFDSRGRLIGVLSATKSWRTLPGLHFDVTIVWPLAFTDEQWGAIRQ